MMNRFLKFIMIDILVNMLKNFFFLKIKKKTIFIYILNDSYINTLFFYFLQNTLIKAIEISF